jgi:hypothetical protein
MGPRLRIARLIAAAAHLGLVGAGALQVLPRGQGWAARAVSEYAALSGAEGFYTFFAPGVDTQLRPMFDVTASSGEVITDTLKGTVNSEVDLRVANLIGLSWSEDFRRALMASWAGAMFARHPGAARVEARVEFYELPSMEEYRAGQRPAWRLFQRATFSPGDTGDEAGR